MVSPRNSAAVTASAHRVRKHTLPEEKGQEDLLSSSTVATVTAAALVFLPLSLSPSDKPASLTLVWEDGEVVRADGVVIWVDGEVVRVDGVVFWVDGEVVRVDGVVIWVEM